MNSDGTYVDEDDDNYSSNDVVMSIKFTREDLEQMIDLCKSTGSVGFDVWMDDSCDYRLSDPYVFWHSTATH